MAENIDVLDIVDTTERVNNNAVQIDGSDIILIEDRSDLTKYVGQGKTLVYHGYVFPPGSIDKDGNVRRTRKFAQMNGATLAKLPEKRYRLTHPDFKYALTPLSHADFKSNSGQKAYVDLMLVGLNEMTMDEDRGSILIKGNPDADVQMLVDVDEGHIAAVDFPLSNSLFSIIWYNIKPVLDNLAPDRSEFEWKKALKDCTDIGLAVYGYYVKLFGFGQRVYMPDFLDYIGLDPEMVQPSQVNALISRMQEFSKLRGTIKTKFIKDKMLEETRLFMIFDYDKITNCFYIQSPFMNRVIERAIRCKAYPYEVRGKVRTDNHGNVLQIPPVTTIAHPYLDNLPSRKAAQLADAIYTLIEVCPDDGIPNLGANKLINRCSEFDYAYRTATNRNSRGVILRRTFKKAYEYLKDYTYLYEIYRNVQLPPIPTVTEVENDDVLRFKHDGKYRNDIIKKKIGAKKEVIENKKNCKKRPST